MSITDDLEKKFNQRRDSRLEQEKKVIEILQADKEAIKTLFPKDSFFKKLQEYIDWHNKKLEPINPEYKLEIKEDWHACHLKSGHHMEYLIFISRSGNWKHYGRNFSVEHRDWRIQLWFTRESLEANSLKYQKKSLFCIMGEGGHNDRVHNYSVELSKFWGMLKEALIYQVEKNSRVYTSDNSK